MSAREILAEFSAGGPRGSWPAEEKAQQLRDAGTPAEVRMDLPSDRFLVVREGGERRGWPLEGEGSAADSAATPAPAGLPSRSRGSAVTDAEKAELSRKVAEANKRSEQRPRG